MAVFPKIAGDDHYISVLNPVAEDRRVMRQSLLPGLLEAVERRLRTNNIAACFEVGNVFFPAKRGVEDKFCADEPERIGIILAGPIEEVSLHNRSPRPFNFFDLKGILERLAESCGTHIVFTPANLSPFQPGQSAEILTNGNRFGICGKVHPTITERFGIKRTAVYAVEMCVNQLVASFSRTFTVAVPFKFPSIDIDISIVLPKSTTWREILTAIRSAGVKIIEDIRLIDIYEGNQVPQERKSLTIRLTFNAQHRSLRMEEAMEARAVIAEQLRNNCDAKVRE